MNITLEKHCKAGVPLPLFYIFRSPCGTKSFYWGFGGLCLPDLQSYLWDASQTYLCQKLSQKFSQLNYSLSQHHKSYIACIDFKILLYYPLLTSIVIQKFGYLHGLFFQHKGERTEDGVNKQILFVYKGRKKPLAPFHGINCEKRLHCRTVHTMAFLTSTQAKILSLGFLDEIIFTVYFVLLSHISWSFYKYGLQNNPQLLHSTCACFIHRHMFGFWLVAAIT